MTTDHFKFILALLQLNTAVLRGKAGINTSLKKKLEFTRLYGTFFPPKPLKVNKGKSTFWANGNAEWTEAHILRVSVLGLDHWVTYVWSISARGIPASIFTCWKDPNWKTKFSIFLYILVRTHCCFQSNPNLVNCSQNVNKWYERPGAKSRAVNVSTALICESNFSHDLICIYYAHFS